MKSALEKNISEINRVLSIGDTGAILPIENESDLVELVEAISMHFSLNEQIVLVDFRDYGSNWHTERMAWGAIDNEIKDPRDKTKNVVAVLAGPVNFLYEDPKVKTYADIWRIIRRAIAVSTSTNCKIFFFTLKGKELKPWSNSNE